MLALRGLNILLGLTMVGFAAVQYNDPDVPQWVLLYAIPALWMYAVTFRLQSVTRSADLMRLLWATVLFYAFAVVFLWPTMADFWRKEVWMVEETAREGMGVMIAFGVVLVALLNVYLKGADAAMPTEAAGSLRT
jgi:Mn2+/Fe2+ NRAMP family transporter